LLHGRRNDFSAALVASHGGISKHGRHHHIGVYTPAFTLQLYASRSQKKLALFLCHIEILIVESD
jgi:hypothetical protein